MAVSPLPDDVKNRIEQEETFRKEVREHLASKKDSWKDFFNSPFSIAILTFLLTAIAAWATLLRDSATEANKQHKADVERRARIAREISYRCAMCNKPQSSGDRAPMLNGDIPKAVAHSEFQGTKLYSLFVELQSLVPDEKNKAAVSDLVDLSRADLTELDEPALQSIVDKSESATRAFLPK